MHAAQAPASSLHSKDADPSGEVNPSDAEALAVSEAGAVVMLVSGAVVSQLQARKITTVRLSGADRYGVSVAVSAYFVPRIPGTRLVVASGDNAMLQDGVLGAAFARPTLLIDTDRLPGNSAAYLQSLGWIGTVTGIGGPAHINDATWTAVLES